jgi:hypothetical protein
LRTPEIEEFVLSGPMMGGTEGVGSGPRFECGAAFPHCVGMHTGCDRRLAGL